MVINASLSPARREDLLQWQQLWFFFFLIFAQRARGQKLYIMKDFSARSLKSQRIMEIGSP